MDPFCFQYNIAVIAELHISDDLSFFFADPSSPRSILRTPRTVATSEDYASLRKSNTVHTSEFMNYGKDIHSEGEFASVVPTSYDSLDHILTLFRRNIIV